MWSWRKTAAAPLVRRERSRMLWKCCWDVSAGYSPPLSTQTGACRPGPGTGIPAPWWTRTQWQTGIKLETDGTMAEKAVYEGGFLQLEARCSSGSTLQRKCLNRESTGGGTTYSGFNHAGGCLGDSVGVRFFVWRPYRQLNGDMLVKAGNSRIKLHLNSSISPDASATPPPANPEMSASGVRRLIVKGPVYDVNFLRAIPISIWIGFEVYQRGTIPGNILQNLLYICTLIVY